MKFDKIDLSLKYFGKKCQISGINHHSETTLPQTS
jgi:hypothetical protein